ncbi:hypothetical protein TcasGA2_TC002225 [Tribolium castaneum]|uniref:Uncharacterized protein n=1 Tax=Tribolium castaneum TaxID=7070 RepID=D6WYA3_TRICA|nr:hypothetical protein TcasGA2_TC002225 [Tribolium castaneum]
MTPLDFFLWGAVKEQVYATPFDTLEELQERITNAIHNVSPELLQRVRRSFLNRVAACEQTGGQQLEHLR